MKKLIAILFMLILSSAQAKFARADLKKVPVDRLAANIQAAIKKAPDNLYLQYNLARVYAMAYAINSNEVQVNTRTGNRIWTGYIDKNLPNEFISAGLKKSSKEALQNLDKAIEHYRTILKKDPKHAKAKLGLGWALMKRGDKKEALATLRESIKDSWPKESKIRHTFGPTFTQEAAGYLIKLLDPEKDSEEIKDLQAKLDKHNRLPRAITPIVMPMNKQLSLAQIVDNDLVVNFDLDGTGEKKWNWISKDSAWLVYDHNDDGIIESGLELFGAVSFWLFHEHGYEALSYLDNDSDEQLSGIELMHISLWQDRNQNGICDEGEVKPVSEFGIKTISTKAHKHESGIMYNPEGFTFESGESLPSYDILLNKVP